MAQEKGKILFILGARRAAKKQARKRNVKEFLHISKERESRR